jgi:hypothetical protein
MHLSASGVLTTMVNQGSGAKADEREGLSGGASGTDHLHHAGGSEAFDTGPRMDMPGNEAETGHAHLIADKGNGSLLCDADGSGGADAMLFAMLAPHSHPMAADVFMV